MQRLNNFISKTSMVANHGVSKSFLESARYTRVLES